MKWTVGEARNRLADVLRAAARKPQLIYRRNRLVAAVVSAHEFEEYQSWRAARAKPTLADTFDALRRLCAEEHYTFEAPMRTDRANPLPDALDELSM